MVDYNSFNLDPDRWWQVIKGTIGIVFRIPKKIYLMIPQWFKIVFTILLVILAIFFLYRSWGRRDEFYTKKY